MGRPASAFIVTDPSNPSIVTNAPEPSESDLRNQLQMHSGFGAAAAGGGWTFTPAVSLEEVWTDNILQTTNNRRWDLLTLATPSIAINGDTPNAQVQFQYGPQFRLAARTPQEDSITNQLVGTGQFTIIPDEFYVNASAFAGGAPVGGGFGALGFGATPNFGGFSSPVTQNGTASLSTQNQVQTNSISVTPYWLHRFGDTGTAKIGYQINESSFSQGKGYVPVLFPSGPNTAYNITNEGIAQFETGDRFAPWRNLTILDASIGNGNFQGNSSQYVASNQLGYQVNRELIVYGQIGYEDLYYSGTPSTRISDATWAVGGTWTPNPSSQINASFGHRYGENNFEFNGSYQLTARTQLAASYTTGVQNFLQGIQNQLDFTSLTPSGEAVNADTGAPMFIGTNGLGVQSGLFRVKSFNASITTVYARDQFAIYFQVAQSTTLAKAPAGSIVLVNVATPAVGSTSNSKAVYGSWTHQMSEVLVLGVSGSVSEYRVSNNGGNTNWGSVSVGLQYLISQTLAATASYSFYDQISSNQNGSTNTSNFNQSYYQNVVLVGLTKQF
jgi:hypothetical protein